MWKLSDTHYLNPLCIAYVRDYPTDDKVRVFFTGNGDSPLYTICEKQERQVLLAYLAQYATMHPPYLVRDDSDEPPF